MRSRTAFVVALLAAVTGTASVASARIKLAALPERERVEIQLNNGNYTLAEEERIIPLLKSGAQNNMIDFSWSNTGETLLALRNDVVIHNLCGEEFVLAGIWAGFGPRFVKTLSQQDDLKRTYRSTMARPDRCKSARPDRRWSRNRWTQSPT